MIILYFLTIFTKLYIKKDNIADLV